MPRPLYPESVWAMWRTEKSLPSLGTEARFLGHPVHGLVTIQPARAVNNRFADGFHSSHFVL